VNVQVLADPAGRLVWASPALPGARHDLGAARAPNSTSSASALGIEHGIDAASDPALARAGRSGTRPLRAG
jgi:hypothetical protein